MENQKEKIINISIQDAIALKEYYWRETSKILDRNKSKHLIQGQDFKNIQRYSKKIDEIDIWIEKYHEEVFKIDGFIGHCGEYA